jgi:hypothetical protein
VIHIAFFLLLAASSRVELVDQDYQIPPGEWMWIPIELKQEAATVIASYVVPERTSQVRIALLAKDDLDHPQEKKFIASTRRGHSGAFAGRAPYPDTYAVLVDNSADKSRAATVRVRVTLDFSKPRATQLPVERQLTVIAVSLLAFFAVVTWSARRLMKSAR